MTEAVLDASALLAFILREPGMEVVERALAHDACIMSAVNLSEVVAKLVDRGVPAREIEEALRDFHLRVREFREGDALAAGLLRASTRTSGLSLGDRACLALARSLGLPAITTDRHWLELDLGVPVVLGRLPAPEAGREQED
jgi:PIN domain nuclease of toxin-antitoxin system